MIKFEHPTYLYFLLFIPLFIVLFIAWRLWKNRVLKEFGESSLVHQLIPAASNSRPVIKFTLLMISWAFLVIGIANPQTGSKLQEAKKQGIDVMVALDVSNSMLAEDIAPSRLANAKQLIADLIDKLEGDRIGIVVFAGKAFLQLPLTNDYGAAKLFLSNIDTRSVGTQGTAIGEALAICDTSFQGSKDKGKAILLLTDGENHEDDAITEAKRIGEKGIRIFTVGMGSTEGAPVPDLDKYGNSAGYKKDRQGNTIISKLDPKLLSEIASYGNGSYIRASNSRGWFNAIVTDLDKLQKQEIDVKSYSDYEDRFQYFIFLALFFLVIELFILERKSRWANKINLFE